MKTKTEGANLEKPKGKKLREKTTRGRKKRNKNTLNKDKQKGSMCGDGKKLSRKKRRL